jgi:Tfp pilus assembly protein PilX
MERVMNTIQPLLRQLHRRPSTARRQRGIVLFIALLVMVALGLASIALMRSTDTATTATGNLVLKQAATSAVDRGIEKAIHALWEVTPAPDRTAHQPTQNYYACVRGTTGACLTANSPVPKIPDLLLKSGGCAGTGLATDLVATDDAGNKSCYVVERMCLNPGPAVRSNCNLSTSNFGADAGTQHYTGLIRAGDAYYRVTVRVEGPRNTVTYAQATLR